MPARTSDFISVNIMLPGPHQFEDTNSISIETQNVPIPTLPLNPKQRCYEEATICSLGLKKIRKWGQSRVLAERDGRA